MPCCVTPGAVRAALKPALCHARACVRACMQVWEAKQFQFTDEEQAAAAAGGKATLPAASPAKA